MSKAINHIRKYMFLYWNVHVYRFIWDYWVFNKERYQYFHSGKIKGSVFYIIGLFLIIFLNMSIIGTLFQLVGFFIIFKSFLPDIYDYITKLPYFGKYLSKNDKIQKAMQFKISSIKFQPLQITLEYDFVISNIIKNN